MKRQSVIDYFGDGVVELAAQRLGITRQAIDKWAVDEAGNITSQMVRDAVLARGYRARVKLLQADPSAPPLTEIEIDLASTQTL